MVRALFLSPDGYVYCRAFKVSIEDAERVLGDQAKSRLPLALVGILPLAVMRIWEVEDETSLPSWVRENANLF